jgi:hypothetical protein
MERLLSVTLWIVFYFNVQQPLVALKDKLAPVSTLYGPSIC